MGFLRRGDARSAMHRQEITVGVGNQRLVLGGAPDELGVTMLAELREYIGAVTGGAAAPIDGHDSVAVLSAKMDQAELVNDICGATLLAFEELAERGLVRPGDVPAEPQLPPVPARGSHYDYIQSAYQRAQVHLGWLAACDEVLRRSGTGLLPPRPDEDPLRRGTRR